MSTYEISCISNLLPELYLLKGEEKRALLISLHLFEICESRTQRQRKLNKKKETTNLWVLLYQRLSCTPHLYRREGSFRHSSYLPPPLALSVLLSHWCFGRWGRGSRPFVLLERSPEEVRGATLGKVTDERAVEGGGGEVAVKGRGRGDRQDRSQGVGKEKNKPF